MRQHLLVLAIFATASAARAATVRVPSEYATINQGIDAASAGDTVLVAPGTYPDFEVRMGTVVPVSACAFLKEGVVLRSESGSASATIDRMGVDTAEPAFTIQVNGLTGTSTLVEGFRITGNPFGNNAVRLQGFAPSGEVTFRDCVFEDLDGGGSAGGVRVLIASARFEDCAFRRCTGGVGGIRFDEGNLTILDTLFEECSAQGVGTGAVQASNPTVQNPVLSCLVRGCRFLDNEGWSSAGASLVNFWGGVVVEDCVFEDNVSQNSGGGLSLGGVGHYTVRRNVFLNNVADGAGPYRFGGAILAGGNFTIEENTIVGSHQGYHLLGGAAIFVEATGPSPPSVIRRNVITDCTGSEAIGVLNGTIVTECNVFWNNAEGNNQGFALDPTDLVADPQFCDPKLGDYTVASTSPCLPENNPSCTESIGALGVGCGLVSIAPMSWGRIKGLYQPNEE